MSPSTTRKAPPPPPPPPPPQWTGYAPATPALAAQVAVPKRKVSHARLFLILGAGLGVLVVLLIVVALVSTPDDPANCPPTTCAPQPPTGPPVTGDHHYESATYKFSLEYFDNTLTEQDVELADDGISLTYPSLPGGGGQLQIIGTPAEGRDAQAVVDDIVGGNFQGAEESYVLPGASVGYRQGYGAVYDLYPQSTSGSAERDRVIVMAAVKDDLAIVAAATGPYYAFTPDGINVGHASAANLVAALFADDPVNTVRWPDDPPR